MGLVFPCHVLSSTKILVVSETLAWLFPVHYSKEHKYFPQLAGIQLHPVLPSQAPARKSPTDPSPWLLPVAQQLGSAGKHILPAGRNTGKR